MDAFEINSLRGELERRGLRYLEFLRAPSMSLGVYSLAVGATDEQKPHTEDEVYYVLSGCARVVVGEEERDVEAGHVIFVEAGVPHRFHTIREDLTLLVFFAPAEGSLSSSAAESGTSI